MIARRARLVAAARVVVLAAAWLGVAAPARGELRVTDDTGATVSLREPARRIVTLAPHAAELVAAAGAGRALVGVIRGSDYPPDVRKLPVIGDANALDLERIAALAPDLIVTWPWTTPAQVAGLRERGVAVFEANARTVDGIAADIERIGTLTGTSATAGAAAASLRQRIARLAGAGSGDPLRVFYEVSEQPLFTLGGGHLVSQAITACGGRNVFAALDIPAPQVGIEAVLAADPQVIIAGTDGAVRPRWLDAWTRWPALAAVRAGALYAVDANLLHRPGPRFVDGIEQLCAAMGQARRALGVARGAPIIDAKVAGRAVPSRAGAADDHAR